MNKLRTLGVLLMLAIPLPSQADDYIILGGGIPVLDWDDCWVNVCDDRLSMNFLLGYGRTFGQQPGDRGAFWEFDLSAPVLKGRIDGDRYHVRNYGAHVGWRSSTKVYLTVRAGVVHTDIDGPDRHEIVGSRTRPAFGIGVGIGNWTIVEHRRFTGDVDALYASYRWTR